MKKIFLMGILLALVNVAMCQVNSTVKDLNVTGGFKLIEKRMIAISADSSVNSKIGNFLITERAAKLYADNMNAFNLKYGDSSGNIGYLPIWRFKNSYLNSIDTLLWSNGTLNIGQNSAPGTVNSITLNAFRAEIFGSTGGMRFNIGSGTAIGTYDGSKNYLFQNRGNTYLQIGSTSNTVHTATFNTDLVVNGVVKFTGGSPAAGKVLTGTDALGNATWQTAAAGGTNSVFGRAGVVVAATGDYNVGQITGAAPLASPPLTGFPTAPTQSTGTNNTTIATAQFVQNAAALKVNATDTSGMLQPYQTKIKLGFNFDSTKIIAYSRGVAVDSISTLIQNVTSDGRIKYTLAGNVYTIRLDSLNMNFIGIPTVPTATAGTNTIQIANTAFVSAAAAAISASTVNLTGNQTYQGVKTSQSVTNGEGVLTGQVMTTGSGTNWAGTNFTSGYTHTIGSVVPLVSSVLPSISSYYQIIMTTTALTAGSITFSFGGYISGAISTNTVTNISPLTSSTAALTITPTTNFDGVVVVSIRQIFTGAANAVWANAAGTNNVELRTSLSTTNQFFGISSGRYNTTGINNTANGNQVLFSNTSGISNTGVGYNALVMNTTGNSNTANGTSALFNNTTGSQSTAIGERALFSNTTGVVNTAVGFNALANITTGNSNTAIGSSAGRFISGGSVFATDAANSIFIGANTYPLANGQSNQNVIGFGAVGIGDNSFVLGNSSVLTTVLRGNVGIGTIAPLGKLEISGSSASTNLVTFDGNRSISITNTDLTVNNAQSIALRATSTNGTIQSGVKLMGVNTARSTSGLTSDLAILTNNDGTITEKMRVLSNGRVGIGTSIPLGILDVNSSSTLTDLVAFDATRSISVVNTNTTIGNASGILFRSVTNSGIVQSGVKLMGVNTARTASTLTSDLSILTNNAGTISEKMRVTSNGSVGIGTSTPNNSSLLDLTSSNKGLLIPRITTTNRDAMTGLVNGMMIYNSTLDSFQYYKGAVWISLGATNVAGNYYLKSDTTGSPNVTTLNQTYKIRDSLTTLLARSIIINNTQLVNTGNTTENVIYTATIPANSIGVNGSYHINGLFSCTASANVKSWRIKIGGTTIATVIPSTNASISSYTIIRNRNSLAVQVSGNNGSGSNTTFNAGTSGAVNTYSFNTATDLTLTVTAQLTLGTETMAMEAFEFQKRF